MSVARARVQAPPLRFDLEGGALALFEPANSVHTLHVPDDNTEDTDVCFIIEGALLNLAEDGSVESVSDGPGTLEAYYLLLEAQGDTRPNGLIV